MDDIEDLGAELKADGLGVDDADELHRQKQVTLRHRALMKKYDDVSLCQDDDESAAPAITSYTPAARALAAEAKAASRRASGGGGNFESGAGAATPDAALPGVGKVWLKTWGCSHNVSDSEYMAGQLAATA